MAHLTRTIFELEQSVPVNEEIDPKSYLLSKTTVTNANHDLSLSICELFKANLDKGPLRFGGTVSVDGVHLKVKGAHYYDFTVHYMELIEKPTFNKVDFRIRPKQFHW